MNRLQQISADVEIRPFEERDYEAVVAVSNAVFPDRPWTADELRYEDTHLDRTKYALERYVAVDRQAGGTCGYGEIRHLPWNFHSRKFGMTIRVSPELWGRGIGARLWDRLLRSLEARGALAVRTLVKEDRAHAMQFVRTRGFTEVMRTWDSHLDVASCDLSRFQEDVARAEAAGVTIVTLGDELANDPSCLPRVHAMEMELGADVPNPDPFTPVDLQQWRQHTVDAPWFIPEAYFIAAVAGQYAGVSTLWRPQTGAWLQQGLTGVKREYRGRGIATALKVRTVEYARAHGYAQIKTENEVHNAPMIAINDRFGFQRQPVWITFLKELAG